MIPNGFGPSPSSATPVPASRLALSRVAFFGGKGSIPDLVVDVPPVVSQSTIIKIAGREDRSGVRHDHA
jgi:hypothetical protein